MKLQSPNEFKKINESSENNEIEISELENTIADIISNNVETREVPYSGAGDGESPDIEIDYSTIEKAAKEIATTLGNKPASKSKEDLIAIIKEAWGNNISSSTGTSVDGPSSYIDGIDDFYKELEEKL